MINDGNKIKVWSGQFYRFSHTTPNVLAGSTIIPTISGLVPIKGDVLVKVIPFFFFFLLVLLSFACSWVGIVLWLPHPLTSLNCLFCTRPCARHMISSNHQVFILFTTRYRAIYHMMVILYRTKSIVQHMIIWVSLKKN